MLNSNVRILLRFLNNSLYEEVSQSYLDVMGDSKTVVAGLGTGYLMKNNQYLLGNGILSSGYRVDIDHKFIFGFFLKPVDPGMVENPTTKEIESLNMTLLELTSTESADNSVVKINEQTNLTNKNNIKVYLDNDSYSLTSSEYDVNLWHHILIIYDSANSSLQIYLDGILDTGGSESGEFPDNLVYSYLDMYVNHSLTGYVYNLSKNYGYVSDIFLMNIGNITSGDIKRIINNGIIYYVDDSYKDIYIEGSSVYFNDPNTITVNSSIDDMSYIYLGRNDGIILRGSPLFWQSRRVFSEEKEAERLGLTSDNISNGFLKLNNKIVRF